MGDPLELSMHASSVYVIRWVLVSSDMTVCPDAADIVVASTSPGFTINSGSTPIIIPLEFDLDLIK